MSKKAIQTGSSTSTRNVLDVARASPPGPIEAQSQVPAHVGSA